MKILELILTTIAWKMPVLAAGSPTHIAILVLTAAAVVCEILLLKRRNSKRTETAEGTSGKVAFFRAAGILLIVMEIIKQVFLTWVRGWNYSWSDFPFQLCSIPMYLMLFYPFLKGRGRRTIENFLMTFGLIGGIAALVEPVSVFSDYVVLTVHSLLWHIILIFTGIFIFASRIGKEPLPVKPGTDETQGAGRPPAADIKAAFHEYRPAGRLYLCLAAAAVMINAVFLKVSGGRANMFFLGPSKPDMFILDDIRLNCGWQVETILFIAATWLAGLIVYILLRLLLCGTAQPNDLPD